MNTNVYFYCPGKKTLFRYWLTTLSSTAGRLLFRELVSSGYCHYCVNRRSGGIVQTSTLYKGHTGKSAVSLRKPEREKLIRSAQGGLVALYELLATTLAAATLIRQGKIHQLPDVMETSRQPGRQSFRQRLRTGKIIAHPPEYDGRMLLTWPTE